MAANLQYRVSAELGLNLRSEPAVKNGTRLAVLPHGQLVTQIASAAKAPWMRVATTLQGAKVEGFASGKYLEPVGTFAAPPSHASLTAVHLAPNGAAIRASTGGRAYPLAEAGQPTRDPALGAAAKRRALGKIVDWLDVEHSARYRRVAGGSTFCNIYAYDYCYLAGVYLPRVWWTPSAVAKLRAGQSVDVSYGNTVNELNANALFNWFRDFGDEFGWARSFDLTELQDAANDGRAVIIVGQNRVPNRSGHICAVVPETGTEKAVRSGASIVKPLQSQAGATNHAYKAWVWWTMTQIRDFAFYVNA